MLMKVPGNIHFAILISILVGSCHTGNNPTDTTTAGNVKIAAAKNFENIIEAQRNTFEAIYTNATINVDYVLSEQLLALLLNDSCKVIVRGSPLSGKEEKVFSSNNIYPISTKIADDAVVIIANKNNPLKNMSITSLKQIVEGKEEVEVVLDNPLSANSTYIKDSLLLGGSFGANVYAMQNEKEVINYISNAPSALGIIALNHISDKDDRKNDTLLSEIKILGISEAKGKTAYKPYPAHIKTKQYPLSRSIYMINRQTRAGLGMGFVSFVAGSKGQLLILKQGLVPSFPPQRIVEINTN